MTELHSDGPPPLPLRIRQVLRSIVEDTRPDWQPPLGEDESLDDVWDEPLKDLTPRHLACLAMSVLAEVRTLIEDHDARAQKELMGLTDEFNMVPKRVEELQNALMDALKREFGAVWRVISDLKGVAERGR